MQVRWLGAPIGNRIEYIDIITLRIGRSREPCLDYLTILYPLDSGTVISLRILPSLRLENMTSPALCAAV